MSALARTQSDRCGDACSRCDLDGVSAPDGRTEEAKLQGWALAAVAAGAFLVPLALAVAGAVVVPLVWRHVASELAGGVAGLTAGMVGSAVLVKRIRGGTRRQR